MSNLYNISKTLILENSSQVNAVKHAIDNHYRVKINYLGDDSGEAVGERTVEVYAYGMSKAGNPLIRVYQLFGPTKTIKPAWKTFRLDKINMWVPTKFKFYRPISDRDTVIPKYNPNGDQSMVGTVYNAQFNK